MQGVKIRVSGESAMKIRMKEEKGNLSEKARQDYALILRVLEGDEKAFAQLFVQYKNSIYFMLLEKVKNPDVAEDLTLEAFGKAFTNLHMYSPEFAFSTWLFRIAINNCIDFLRKERGIFVTIDDNEDNGGNAQKLKSNEPDPEEKLIKKQKVTLLHNFVQRLKPRYRTLIELRYFKEYSYREIAEELNISIGTVKGQLFRSRKMLFDLIENTELQ